MGTNPLFDEFQVILDIPEVYELFSNDDGDDTVTDLLVYRSIPIID
jgi:hypothetical protein